VHGVIAPSRTTPTTARAEENVMATKKTAEPAAKTTKSAAKPAAKTPPVKASAAKATAAPKGAKPNALQQPLKPSKELAAIVGAEPLARGRVVSLVWDYIKQHKLQNPDNKREIVADDKLRHVFGKDRVTMFEMNKHLAAHLS
jgi:upstream activation factor subunit UAF30